MMPIESSRGCGTSRAPKPPSTRTMPASARRCRNSARSEESGGAISAAAAADAMPIQAATAPNAMRTDEVMLEPPADHDLLVGVDLDRVATVGLEVAEEALLGPAEREERHRRGDADVDAEHAGLDA